MTETQVHQLGKDHLTILTSLKQKIFNMGLVYGWKADIDKPYDQGHWNRRLLNNSRILPYDHRSMPYIRRYPEVSLLWDHVISYIGDRALLRAYTNGYTYGTDGYLHKDDVWISKVFGADALSETVIFYLNDSWDPDWAGETVIFDDEKEIEKSVLPKFGKMLIFDSNKLHAARPLSRAYGGLRQIFVFKTIDKRFISKEVEYILERTQNNIHTNRSFFEHLFNTMLTLENFNCNKNVLKAGLFHSIYGTENYSFKDPTVTRSDVKKLIGEYAEHLVWLFCTMKNRTEVLKNNSHHLSDEIYKDLLHIEIANLTEQAFDTYANDISQLKNKLNEMTNVKS